MVVLCLVAVMSFVWDWTPSPHVLSFHPTCSQRGEFKFFVFSFVTHLMGLVFMSVLIITLYFFTQFDGVLINISKPTICLVIMWKE